MRAGAIVLLLAACGGSSDPADAGADAPRPDAPRLDAGPPAPPPSEPGRHEVTIEESRRIVPSEGLPAEAPAQTSNNNLDVVRFGGRVYLAFRSGPYHFASPEVRIHVVSSEDEVSWRYEHTFSRTTDLREPRWLEVGGTLFLYLAELGTNRLDFEPMQTLVSSLGADGTWSELAPLEGFGNAILWRARTERGTAYATAYFGGEMVYDFLPDPMMRVELFTTDDGLTFRHVDPAQPTLYVGGASETDFSVGDDGTVFGVMRQEAGDATGMGSRVCHTTIDRLGEWTCHVDRRKFDSPLAFFHDGEHYLVARRNVTEDGFYDVAAEGDVVVRSIRNQGLYINTPKRCALWRWIPDEDRVAFVLDLPSAGDTCFPGRIDGARPDEVVIYDYSSDPAMADLAWNDGQVGPTFIYRHVLRFTPR
jgi:hypothetical protein